MVHSKNFAAAFMRAVVAFVAGRSNTNRLPYINISLTLISVGGARLYDCRVRLVINQKNHA